MTKQYLFTLIVNHSDNYGLENKYYCDSFFENKDYGMTLSTIDIKAAKEFLGLENIGEKLMGYVKYQHFRVRFDNKVLPYIFAVTVSDNIDLTIEDMDKIIASKEHKRLPEFLDKAKVVKL